MPPAHGPTLIDVRSAEGRALDPRAIPGAIGIALRELPSQLAAFSDGRELIVFCDCPNDETAIAAARVLMAAGLPRVRVLAGGLDGLGRGRPRSGPTKRRRRPVGPQVAAHPA